MHNICFIRNACKPTLSQFNYRLNYNKDYYLHHNWFLRLDSISNNIRDIANYCYLLKFYYLVLFPMFRNFYYYLNVDTHFVAHHHNLTCWCWWWCWCRRIYSLFLLVVLMALIVVIVAELMLVVVVVVYRLLLLLALRLVFAQSPNARTSLSSMKLTQPSSLIYVQHLFSYFNNIASNKNVAFIIKTNNGMNNYWDGVLPYLSRVLYW